MDGASGRFVQEYFDGVPALSAGFNLSVFRIFFSFLFHFLAFLPFSVPPVHTAPLLSRWRLTRAAFSTGGGAESKLLSVLSNLPADPTWFARALCVTGIVLRWTPPWLQRSYPLAATLRGNQISKLDGSLESE